MVEKAGNSPVDEKTKASERLQTDYRFVEGEKDIPNGLDICKKRLYTLIDKIEKVNVNEKQIEPFLPYIYEKLSWLDREKLIKHFVSAEFNRYLSYYNNSKDINVEAHEKGNAKRQKRNRRKYYNSKKRNRKYKRNKRKRMK